MNLKKAYIWNTLGSGLNSFNSLFFMIVVTRINGIKDAGIFTLSFATSCMLYIIAIYCGRTYQVTETEKDIDDNEFIVHRLLSSLIMIIVSFLFAFVNRYNFYKLFIFMLLCLFKCIDAICDVFHGILQKNDRLDIVGKSLFIRSLLNILIFIILDIFTKNLLISCTSLVVTNILILIIIDIRKALKYKEKTKLINYKSVYRIFILGFFTFGVSFIANYLVNAPRYAIDSAMSEKFQTIFGIIVMPASIIMLINQFVIQPVIIMLKEDYLKKDKRKFLLLIYKIIGITVLIGIFSIVLAYFFGVPVLNILYGLNLDKYIINLIIVLLGAILYTIASVLLNALIILRKTKIQLLIYIFTSVLAFIISYKFVDLFGFNGAIYSYLIIMIILLILYIIYFFIVMCDKKIWKRGTDK